MKFMKWMTVTALATATVFGSFVESAEALVRMVNLPSSRGGNAEFIVSLFNLYSIGRDGKPILDMNDDDDIGLFPRAVENYINYPSIIEQNPDLVDSFFLSSEGLNLEELFDLPDIGFAANQQISEVIEFEDTKDLINKINSKLKQKGADVSQQNVIDFVDLKAEKIAENSINYSFLISGTNEVLETFNFVMDDSSRSDSINLLSQIIENFSSGVTSKGGSPVISEAMFNEEIPDPQAVPESKGIISLLGLGILGLGVTLKRKLK